MNNNTTHEVSTPYIELENLIKVTKHHREHCTTSCNISLIYIKWTCERLYELLINRNEIEDARALIDNTNWY